MANIPPLRAVKIVKPIVTLNLFETDLTMPVGKCRQTAVHKVKCTDGLHWTIQCYPNGMTNDHEGYIGIYLVISAPATARLVPVIDGIHTDWMLPYSFTPDKVEGIDRVASHEQLRPLFRDGYLTIKVEIDFDVEVPWAFFTHELFQSCLHLPMDLVLVVGDRKQHHVKVHKSLLSLVSPVFNAMLTDGAEVYNLGMLDLPDFDYATVNAAVDYLYGKKLVNPTIEMILGMLRFADRYIINIFADLDHIPRCNISEYTFCPILRYAVDCSKPHLFKECALFFKNHHAGIDTAQIVETIPAEAAFKLLKNAFSLNNLLEILHKAYIFGFTTVLDHQEQSVIDSLCLNNFSNVVAYAWTYSRESIRMKCAEFLKQHWLEITCSPEFLNLDAEVIKELMIAANNVGVLKP